MAKRSDANQPEIVEALRKAGATVQDLHEVGKGCPDILVSWWDHRTERWELVLMEIKTPRGRLTPDERAWHTSWAGPVFVVYSVYDALAVIGARAEPISRPARNVAQSGRRR